MPQDTAGKEYMGKKDLVGKDFFADRRRFAELLNAILYHGKEIIRAEELEPVARNYQSLLGKGEMARDIFMKDMKRNVCYGLELETESDYSMPERVMAYDACELEQQIKEIGKRHEVESQDREKLVYREKKSRMKVTDFLMPVVTVVLYLGDNHWEGRHKLSELYNLPEEIRNLADEVLPDYGFPLAEADYIDSGSFKTDLKEFFQAMQCRKDRDKLRELLKSESFQQLNEDALCAIAVHLDRKRLTAKIEKEGLSMCPALKEWAEEERKEGLKEGLKKGEMKRKEERTSIIKNMIREGMDYEMIHRITKCSRKEFSLAAGN